MNIHPAFVHFPIALLTIYACLECIRFKKILSLPYWFYLKATFVVLGTVGAVAARQTGEMAGDALGSGIDPMGRKLLEAHGDWATRTTALFVLIAVAYALSWIRRSGIIERCGGRSAAFMEFVCAKCDLIVGSPVMIIAALAGLFSITATGALGGAMVYGPTFDPATNFFYTLLVGV